jgi:alkanesulfonate monooxygenase SsuD/methylene tetrahydromethanopterin reductase-like flavin-dependent oxidoreductase (luciferase family)
VKFSLFFNVDGTPEQTPGALYRAVERQVCDADARTCFANAWVAEHHFALYGRLPAPLLLLARLSGLTRRIGLGAAVVEAPHYHPLRLAEDAALVDVLSEGRLRLGVGSGAKFKPAEFAAFGADMTEKAKRTHEIVTLLEQAFTTGRLDFAGDFYRYTGVLLDPPPVQSARELLHVAASGETPEWAGSSGFRLLVPRIGAASDHYDRIRRYRDASRAAGNGPGYVGLLRLVFVAETERDAHAQARRALARCVHYDLGFEWDGRTGTPEYRDLLRRLNAVVGTSEQVAEQLAAWRDEFGPDELLCHVSAAGIRHEDALASIGLLAEALESSGLTEPRAVESKPGSPDRS